MMYDLTGIDVASNEIIASDFDEIRHLTTSLMKVMFEDIGSEKPRKLIFERLDAVTGSVIRFKVHGLNKTADSKLILNEDFYLELDIIDGSIEKVRALKNAVIFTTGQDWQELL